MGTPPLDTPLPTSAGSRLRSAEELSDYVARIGGLLARYGCPAYRIETLVRLVGEIEGHEAEAFALPTGLFVTVTPRGTGIAPVHRMVRLREWGVDLDKLLFVDRVFNEVAADRRTIEDARLALTDVEHRPPPYGPIVSFLATGATSAGAAVFFQGGLLEAALATVLGLSVHGLSVLLARHPQGRFLLDFAGALLCATGAVTFATAFGAARNVLLLAGMITLFPGMTLTTGLAEVAMKNLVAGGARLMEALVTFLALLFGIGLSQWIADAAHLGAVAPAPTPLGVPAQITATVVLALGFGVAFRVPRGLLWAAIVSCATSWTVTLLGQAYLAPHVAAFLAATAVCSGANALARFTDRPAQLYQLPGMMLLVPGSLGFTALEGMLQGSWLAGAERLVSMLLIAGGLVMGVLLANVLVPPKKVL